MSEPIYWWLQGILLATLVEAVFWLLYIEHLKEKHLKDEVSEHA